MRQKGFILIELIVVMVMIAILAGVAIPLYMNFVNNNKSICIDELVICPKCNTSLGGIKPTCGTFTCYKKCPNCGYDCQGMPLDKCNKGE